MSTAKPERIRIAFIGGSHSHADAKIKLVKASPAYELAGLWEKDQQLAARYAGAGIPLISLEQILADTSITVVAVESSVKEHAEHGLAALKAGKHLHLEKPPAVTMRELRGLVALARERGRVLQVGYMWRYHPGLRAILEAGSKGWLGQIYSVRGQINTLIPDERRPELALFKGGQMFELGCHLIDATVRLLGKPLRVTPILREHGPQHDALKDNTVAVLEYPRALAVIQSATLQPRASAHRSFEVAGSNGTATLRPIEAARLEFDLVKAAGPYAAGITVVELPPYQRYVDDFKNLAGVVRSEESLPLTLDQEMMVHETVLAASGML